MRKLKKILVIILTIILFFVALIIAFGPNYAKGHLEENSKDLVGRKISMDELDFNVFNGHLMIAQFKFYEKNDSNSFVYVDTLYTNMALYKLFSKEVLVQSFHLKGLAVNIDYEKEVFNFDDLIPKDTVDNNSTEAADESGMINIIRINDILISRSELAYNDKDFSTVHNMEDLNIAIPGITIGKDRTNAGLQFDLSKGGNFDIRLEHDAENGNFNCKLGISGLNISPYLSYAQPFINISDLEGFIDVNLSLIGNVDQPSIPEISGDFALQRFALFDKDKEKAIALDSLNIGIEKFDLNEENYQIGKLFVNNFNINAIQYQDYDNISSLMIAEDTLQSVPQDSIPSNTKPLVYHIDELIVQKSSLNYKDLAIENGPFNYQLDDISILANNVTEGIPVRFDINALMNKKGTLESKIIVDPSQEGMDGVYDFYLCKIPIKDFSVFSLNSTAYPIEGGQLLFHTKNTIKGGHLNSHIVTKIYKTELGDKRKELDPEYKVPLKLALAVLEDPKKSINFDFPAEGDVNDPEFKYRKIIWKVVLNVLLKAATSPYNLLASAVGANEDDIKFIRFNPLQVELGPEQNAQLDLIAEVLNSKPIMAVEASQNLNVSKQKKLIAEYLAKKGFFLEKNYGSDTVEVVLNEVDKLRVLDLDKKKKITAFLEGKTGVQSGEKSYDDLVKLYVDKKDIERLFIFMIQERAKLIQEYMDAKDLADRFLVNTSLVDDAARVKPRFDMKYSVKGD